LADWADTVAAPPINASVKRAESVVFMFVLLKKTDCGPVVSDAKPRRYLNEELTEQ
jgi:hypothetical protein